MQQYPEYLLWNRRKTLTGSPDPTRAYGKQTLHNLWRIQPVGSISRSFRIHEGTRITVNQKVWSFLLFIYCARILHQLCKVCLPYARVGSSDPVRVLRLFHNKYSGYCCIHLLYTTTYNLSLPRLSATSTTGCLRLCNSGLPARADVHCLVSRGQLPGTVLYLPRTVSFWDRSGGGQVNDLCYWGEVVRSEQGGWWPPPCPCDLLHDAFGVTSPSPLLSDRMTDVYGNITFAHYATQAVKKVYVFCTEIKSLNVWT